MNRRYDAIVIGAGIGGLSTAVFLAKRGQRVLLLERRNIPGGFASSFVRGRFEFEVALHALTGSGPSDRRSNFHRYLEELGITDRLEFIRLPDLHRSIFPDSDVTLPLGREAYEQALVELFPQERAGIGNFLARVDAVADEAQAVSQSSQRPNPLKLVNLLRYLPSTWGQVLNRDVSDPRARALISQVWPYLGLGPSEASFVYFALALRSMLLHGACYIKGRSQHLANSMLSVFVELGGELQLSTEVESITQSQGRVTGVITESGEYFNADVVISNANPITTVKDMIGVDHIPSGYFDSLAHRKPSASTFNIYLGLARPHDELGLTTYETFINDSVELDEHARKMNDLALPSMTLVTTYNIAWPEISPPGTTILVVTSLMYGEAWYDLDPADYEKTKHRIADHMLTMVEETLAPNIRNSIEVISTSTPLTNIRYTGTMAGAIYGSAPTPSDSTVLRVPHKGPLGGLYLVGAWTPPGGGFEPVIMGGRAVGLSVLEEQSRRE